MLENRALHEGTRQSKTRGAVNDQYGPLTASLDLSKASVQVVVWSSFMSWCNTAYCVIPQSCSRFIGSQVPSVRKPAPIQKFLNPWTQLGAWCLTETNLSYIMSHWTISCLGASDFLESPQVANRWSNPVSKNFTKCQTIPWIWNDSPSGSNKMTTSHSHDRLLHRKFFV